jgi:hypothetical protein
MQLSTVDPLLRARPRLSGDLYFPSTAECLDAAVGYSVAKLRPQVAAYAWTGGRTRERVLRKDDLGSGSKLLGKNLRDALSSYIAQVQPHVEQALAGREAKKLHKPERLPAPVAKPRPAPAVAPAVTSSAPVIYVPTDPGPRPQYRVSGDLPLIEVWNRRNALWQKHLDSMAAVRSMTSDAITKIRVGTARVSAVTTWPTERSF